MAFRSSQPISVLCEQTPTDLLITEEDVLPDREVLSKR